MSFKTDVVIGLEIHLELDTNTKLFCSCPTNGSLEPNTRTCEVCLGMPGSKPSVNKKAIESAVLLAKSLNCKIRKRVIFSRKNYFYPDLAKNYQITQYEEPLGENGFLELGNKRINIKRIHLEEDPASLLHPGGISNANFVLVDYNRSGNPLCEIVTEPDIASPQEARDLLKSMITIFRYLNIFSPEKNIIKADANVSIKESGYIRTELKNITGFKEIEKALNYEIARQKSAAFENKNFEQETRAWDSEKGITYLLRKKETEEDYGYIFESDIPPITLTNSFINPIMKKMPEMPCDKVKRYIKEFNLSYDDSDVIAREFSLAKVFENSIKKVEPVLAARWIRRELARVLNYNDIDASEMKINEKEFTRLLVLLEERKITEKVGQKIIEELAIKDINVDDFIKSNSLEALSDSNELEKYCREAIGENQNAVMDYKSGKETALNFLLGSVMRKSKGKADPKEVKEVLIRLLLE